MPLSDEQLAVWFTPDAIRSHFEGWGDNSEIVAWVERADDDDLRRIGDICVSSDLVWKVFHDSLVLAIEGWIEGEG